jgi:hypothetical protein
VCDDVMTKDQIANYLLGLEAIYTPKFDDMWSDFEQFLKQYYGLRNEVKGEK